MKNTQFVQKAKVGVAGNFFNQLMSNNASTPEVGRGATEMHYTDRTCYEVISVSDDLKTVRLEALDAEIDPAYLKSLNGRDCTGHQNWIFKPTGRFLTVVYRHGAWRSKLASLGAIGVMLHYSDHPFVTITQSLLEPITDQ